MRGRALRCTVAAFCAALLAPAGVAQASPAEPFATLAPGVRQSLYASGLPSSFGIAFVPANGDLFAANDTLYRAMINAHQDVHGSTIATTVSLGQQPGAPVGLVNGRNGNIYENTQAGVQELDLTGEPVGTTIGPAGNSLGITVDPQTGNLVYAGQDGIDYVSVDGRQSGTFAAGIGAEGVAFAPTGDYLFATVGGAIDVISRSGSVVQTIALSTPGSLGAAGMALHAGTPSFLVSNNNSGDITRFDFPAGDYTKPPVQSVFASGGSRGGLADVGTDGCLYVSQQNTRFADGTLGAEGSVVRICTGFQPPIPVKTTLVAKPYTLKLLPGNFSVPYYLGPLFPSGLALTPSATLTAGDYGWPPLAGEPVTFTAAGQTICTATTDANGFAKCDGIFAGLAQVLLGVGYQAAFAGDGSYQASTAQGAIVG